MASHWPVIVGINQYQALQPLLFAQFDATELKDFLVNEAGIPPHQCSLLTDISPMVYQGAAFPTRDVILQRLQQSCDQAVADDTVWFFFSGYGVHWQGQDYLLPIDGDPRQVAQTGISLQAVVDTLQRSRARQRLLILDMNRSQSALPNQRLGVSTMELAKAAEMPLLLSCRPNQFSQETLAVRHGLFTAAMLEGLRFHGCLTLSQLAAYLNDRVPELCQHHFRPEQNPVLVIPTQHQFLMLVPPEGVGQMAAAPSRYYGSTNPIVESPNPIAETWPQIRAVAEAPAYDSEPALAPEPATTAAVAVSPALPVGEPPAATGPRNEVAAGAAAAAADHPSNRAATAPWQLWFLVAAGMLLLGVLLRNQATFLGGRGADTETGGTVESIEGDNPPETESAPPAPSPDESAAASAEDSTGAEPLFPEPTSDGAVNPQMAVEQARVAIDQRRFGEALNWLEQIPPEQRPEDFAALQEQAQTGYNSASRSGEQVLSSARQIIEPLSASLFNDAIEEARQVPVGDEYYEQAQVDIARWSAIILDLAQGRAAKGDFDDAIAAARLVPPDQGDVYSSAQNLIQQWQQQQVNRQILQDAQARPQPDQATSFEEAIQLAQQIPPGTPEYEVAQQRINQWSEDILVIARARAAAGQLPGAIAAAELVPPGTSAYDQAQAEIQRWQQTP